MAVPSSHLAPDLILYTTVCGLVLVTLGSSASMSEFHWILPLGRKMYAPGMIRFMTSTASTRLPLLSQMFHSLHCLPRATTMLPPFLVGPLLQVSGFLAQSAYPGELTGVLPPPPLSAFLV